MFFFCNFASVYNHALSFSRFLLCSHEQESAQVDKEKVVDEAKRMFMR